MPKIVLEVAMENMGSVVTVLNSLKDGLIKDIQIESQDVQAFKSTVEKVEKKINKRKAQYQPKTNRVIYEEEQQSLASSGKYLDPKAFKERLRQKKGL